ncbi:hypothetical protein YC2023_056307 [Brassica napus]
MYALKYINHLRSIQKNQQRFSDRESIGQRDQKRRSRTDSRSNRRRSRRKDGAIRATAFPETKAGKTGAVRATVSQKRKLAIAERRQIKRREKLKEVRCRFENSQSFYALPLTDSKKGVIILFFLSSGRLRLDQTSFYTRTLEILPTLREPRASEITCTTQSQKLNITQTPKTNKDKEEKRCREAGKENIRKGVLNLALNTSLPN